MPRVAQEKSSAQSSATIERAATTRRLAVMNLALRGIEADFDLEHADTFRRDLRADFILAGPQFNDTDWFLNDDDVRCISCDVILPMSREIAV